MSWSLCTCKMPDFQHAICPVHDVPATAGSCSEPRPAEWLDVCCPKCFAEAGRKCYYVNRGGNFTFLGKPHKERISSIPAPAVPFSLPLKPDGLHRTGDINDASGKLVAQVYVSELARDYVIAAVNSHEELKRERDSEQDRANVWHSNWLSEKDKRFAAEQQKEELLKALEAVKDKAKRSIPSAIGFTQGDLQAIVQICDAAIAKAKRGDQQ